MRSRNSRDASQHLLGKPCDAWTLGAKAHQNRPVRPAADTAGYPGLEDGVNNHWGTCSRLRSYRHCLGVGSELGSTGGTGSNSDVITALRRGTSDNLNQTGQKVVQQNLNIQPTLTVRPGFPVRVVVNRDLVLEPYKG
jgi:type IV secretion system protein TrbI